jgi:hypothetical protein
MASDVTTIQARMTRVRALAAARRSQGPVAPVDESRAAVAERLLYRLAPEVREPFLGLLGIVRAWEAGDVDRLDAAVKRGGQGLSEYVSYLLAREEGHV